MNRFITLLVLGAFIAPAIGCSSFVKCFRGERTQVPVLDEQLWPVTTVEVKGKFGGEYAMVPREILENVATTRPTQTKKSAAASQPARASTTNAGAQDDKMRVSWDNGSKIRNRCIQKFGAADLFPGRAGDWHLATASVTADGYLDPAVVGPIVEKVRERNQARLAKNPSLRADQLEFVCFNYHSPTGEMYPEHLTNDGHWALITPTSTDPGGRIVLSGGVLTVAERAATADSDHQVGAVIMAFAIIPY